MSKEDDNPASRVQKGLMDGGTSGWFPYKRAKPPIGNDAQWDPDKLELRWTADEPGVADYLPGEYVIDVKDVAPTMNPTEIANTLRRKANKRVREIVRSIRDQGKSLRMIPGLATITLYVGAHAGLIGEVGNIGAAENIKKKARRIQAKIKLHNDRIRGKSENRNKSFS